MSANYVSVLHLSASILLLIPYRCAAYLVTWLQENTLINLVLPDLA